MLISDMKITFPCVSISRSVEEQRACGSVHQWGTRGRLSGQTAANATESPLAGHTAVTVSSASTNPANASTSAASTITARWVSNARNTSAEHFWRHLVKKWKFSPSDCCSNARLNVALRAAKNSYFYWLTFLPDLLWSNKHQMAKKSTFQFVPGVGGTHASKVMQSLNASTTNLTRWVCVVVWTNVWQKTLETCLKLLDLPDFVFFLSLQR